MGRLVCRRSNICHDASFIKETRLDASLARLTKGSWAVVTPHEAKLPFARDRFDSLRKLEKRKRLVALLGAGGRPGTLVVDALVESQAVL